MLAGRYELERRLAVGGMGEVWIATDDRLGRRVAVKLLKEELATSSDFVERFRREARTAAALSHPNIAQVYDYGAEGARHYIVMEYVEGTDLNRVLVERHRLPVAEAVDIAAQVAAALAAAHRAGVIHRDIKPGNVIVGPDGHVRITDFGIARAVGEATLTQAGMVMGTAQYLAPEQVRGQTATPATDLYSLGILLFHMLTGAAPFTGDTPLTIAMRHIEEPVPAPSAANPEVPSALDAVIARATAKAPHDRYTRADELAAALRRSLDPSREPQPAATTALAPAAHTVALAGAPARGGAGSGGWSDASAFDTGESPAYDADAADDDAWAPRTRAMPAAAPQDHAYAPMATRAQARRRPGGTLSGLPVPPWAIAVGVVVLLVVVGLLIGSGGDDTPEPTPRKTVYVTATTDAAAAEEPTEEPEDEPADDGGDEPAEEPVTQAPDPVQAGPVMPDGAIGRPGGAVEAQLEDQGFAVRKVRFPSFAPKDTVVATVPEAGAELRPDQRVVLVLSDGQRGGLQKGDQRLVPDQIVGVNVQQAVQQLEAAGIRVTKELVDMPGVPGTVLLAYPGSGETVQDAGVLLVVVPGQP